MALKRTSDLDDATTLDGTELVAVSQGGATVKATVTDIVNTASGAVTSFNTRTGAVVPTSGDYTFDMIGSTPTTLAGYGITDGYTDADAQDAVVASAVTDGDTTHAPSGDAVHDALAGKADTGDVPATTDDLAEGSTNLYFTGARVGSSLAAGSGISLSTASGVTTITATGGLGTVTSVALTLPAEFAVAGSPVTGSGTLAGAWADVAAGKVLAGPSSGADAAPSFRALAADDLPASGVSADTYGDATHVPQMTVDAAGRVTDVSEVAITGGTSGAVPINTAQTGAYTFVLADAGCCTPFNSSTAADFTIPANSSVAFDIGTVLYTRMMGTAAATFVGASGVTVNNANSAAMSGIGDWLAAVKVGTDEWDVL